MKVYVVFGMTGEYDDSRDWDVRAFASQQKAEAFRKSLQDIADEFDHSSSLKKRASGRIESLLQEAGDTYAHVDYTGTNYGVHELEYEE